MPPSAPAAEPPPAPPAPPPPFPSARLVKQNANGTALTLAPGTSSETDTMGCFAYAVPLPSQHFVLNALQGTNPPEPMSGAHHRSFASVPPFGPWICTRSGESTVFVTVTVSPLPAGTTVIGAA